MSQITIKAKDGTTVTFDGRRLTASLKSKITTIVASSINAVHYEEIEGWWSPSHRLGVSFGPMQPPTWDGASYVSMPAGYVTWYFADKHAVAVRSLHEALRNAMA